MGMLWFVILYFLSIFIYFYENQNSMLACWYHLFAINTLLLKLLNVLHVYKWHIKKLNRASIYVLCLYERMYNVQLDL